MTGNTALPDHYTAAFRSLLRFAIIMIVIGLLSGIAFQESSKKMPLSTPAGELDHVDAVMPLALVHGHIFLMGVVLPVSVAAILYFARLTGGRDVTPRALRWTIRMYLPSVSVSIALMLYKGYHILLSARWGETDLAAIDADFFGGSKAFRYGIYGVSHVAMGLALFIFAWTTWRSMKRRS